GGEGDPVAIDVGGDEGAQVAGAGVQRVQGAQGGVGGRTPRAPVARVGEGVGLLVQVVLLDVGQDLAQPGPVKVGVAVGVACDPRRQPLVYVVVAVQAEADLLEVVLAAGAGGGLAHLLDGGQEQADQHRDDGDH